VPTKDQVASVTADLARRAALPEHLPAVLGALHKDTHPMIQFSTAVLALQARPCAAAPGPAGAGGATARLPAGRAGPAARLPACKRGFWLGSLTLAYTLWRADGGPAAARQPESQFAAAYARGVPKTKYWEYAYEDSMNLIAKLPGVAAHIYRNTYHGGKLIGAQPGLDWAANLSHMMGARPRPPAALRAPPRRTPGGGGLG